MSASPQTPLADLFAPESDDRDGRPWWQRRRAAVGAAVVLVVVLVAALATGALGAGGPSYRTAVATERPVDAELTGVATIEPVSQATVGFAASGTVASVAVKVGDEVAAGAVLATLDTKSLEQDLHDAQAALAEAQLTLENGLNGTKATTSPSSGSSGGSSGGGVAQNAAATSGTTDGSPSAAASSATSTRIVFTAASSDPELAAAQQAVLDAQHQVDVALTAAETAYANALTVCGIEDPDATTTTTTPSATTTDTVDPDACATALKDSITAQKAVQTAQNQLVAASVAYDELLAERAANSGSGGSTTAPGGGTDTGSDTGGQSGTTGAAPSGGSGGSSTGSAPTSADLIAYQKAVDAAAAEVAVAEQAIARATITTPIAGTVESVTLSVGESVSDASTQNIVVKGAGGFQATTTVSVTDVADVEVGQDAFVRPDGADTDLKGTVAAISVAPVSSSTATSYRVTIALDDADADLNNGNTGSITIVTDQTDAGLAVPTSAIGVANGRHYVTVRDGGDTRRVFVEVGVMGREWTSVTDGLAAGDVVVLADLDEPLPSSATASSGSSGSGGTTFPGGGSFPGGSSGSGGPPAFGGAPPGN